jgi:hypothetical protein
MTQLRKVLAVSLLMVLAFAFGCAPPAAAEKEEEGSSHSHMDKAGGEALLDSNALYLKTDESFVHVLNGNVKVCEEDAINANDYGRTLIDSIKALHDGAVYVVLSRNGSYEAHTADKPTPQQDDYCGKNGGKAWIFRYYQEPDAGFISNFSLTSAFSSLTKGGENAPCEGSGSVSLTFTPDMQVFKISGGKLQAPSLNVSVEAEAAASGSVKCSKSLSSGRKLAMVGFIPVLYEVELTFSVALEVAQAAHISATVGTSGGKMTISAQDTTVTLTPAVELGVKLYEVIGASVGVDMPVTASFPAGKACTPDLSLSVNLHGGVSSPLGVSKALGLDFSVTLLGPYSIASAQCLGGGEAPAPAADPPPAPAPAPACACMGGRGVGGVDLGAFPCGQDVCGQDLTMWSCSADGVWSNPGQACGQ